MTPTQEKFVELEKRKTEVKQYFEELKLATQAVVEEIGTDNYFQDDEGTVYKTVESQGKFVYFDKYEILRTRREDERAGSLSLKEAKEAGFEF